MQLGFSVAWSKLSASEGVEWPAPRSASGFCPIAVEGRTLWVMFGGLGLRRHNDLWCFDLDSGVWTNLFTANASSTATSAPSTRCKVAMASVTVDDEPIIVVHGGWGATNTENKYGDLWAFRAAPRAASDGAASTLSFLERLQRGRWEQVAPGGDAPAARSSHSMEALDDRSPSLFLFAGIGANKYGDGYVGTFRVSSKSNALECQWRAVHAYSGPPRSSYGSLLRLARGKFLVFGGLTCGQLNDVTSIDVVSKQDDGSLLPGGELRPNSAKESAPYKRGRHGSTVVQLAGSPHLVVFGGTDLRKRDNAVFTFDFVDGREWRRCGAAASTSTSTSTHSGVRPWMKSLKPLRSGPPPMEGAGIMNVPGTTTVIVFGGYTKDGWTKDLYVGTIMASRIDEVGGGDAPAAAVEEEAAQREPSDVMDTEFAE